MKLFELVQRPPLPVLRESERKGTKCHFVLRPAGTGRQLRFDGRVLRIQEIPDKRQLVVVFRVFKSGDNLLSLSIRVSTEDDCTGRVKPLCQPELIPLMWCATDSRARSLLAPQGIKTLGHLKSCTEVEVCEKLHAPDIAPTHRSKKDAVELFVRLRGRLQQIGFESPCKDGPADRATLRDAMFS